MFRRYGAYLRGYILFLLLVSLPGAQADVMLWAWDRPEDLHWLPAGVGVAYFASQFDARDGLLTETMRRAPLYVPPGTVLVPVFHIEAFHRGHPPALEGNAPERWAEALAQAARRANVMAGGAVQIDFEARSGQRDFYRAMLRTLRGKLPAGVHVSITALASWCGDAAWLDSLPVDEVVPMYFRMGPAERALWRGRLLRPATLPARCRPAAGMALDEWPAIAAGATSDQLTMLAERRLYLFTPHRWQDGMLDGLQGLPHPGGH